jgi:hypothetical protein
MAFRFRRPVPSKRLLVRGADGVARPLQTHGRAPQGGPTMDSRPNAMELHSRA